MAASFPFPPSAGAPPARAGGPCPRPPARFVVIAAAVLAVLAGGWLWLRDSPLVGVRQVTVTGADGPEAAQIRRAARGGRGADMTHPPRPDGTRCARRWRAFPIVKDVRVHPSPPASPAHRIIEHEAVGAVLDGGRRVPRRRRRPAAPGAPAGSLPARDGQGRARGRSPARPKGAGGRSACSARRRGAAAARRQGLPGPRGPDGAADATARSSSSAARSAWRPSGPRRSRCWPTRRPRARPTSTSASPSGRRPAASSRSPSSSRPTARPWPGAHRRRPRGGPGRRRLRVRR